jgi:hypothetical protein
MNDWNSLETQLRAWTPRRPSAGLKQRALAQSVAAGGGRRIALGWLAPATVCLLLMFVTFNQRSGELARLTTSNQVSIMAVSGSNSSFAAYLPGSFDHDRNGVQLGTFEWTNHGHSPSSIPSFPQSRTNYLKR